MRKSVTAGTWRLKFLVFFIVWGALWAFPAFSHANMTIKISVNNPSPFEARPIPVKSYLPRGIKLEHVINTSGLDIAYDEARDQCFVYKDLTLAPQETMVYDIGIVDIWLIDNAVLENLEIRARDITRKLEATDKAGLAGTLQQKIKDQISAIRKNQQESTAEKVGPSEHIRIFEANKSELEVIQADVKSLAQLWDALEGKGAMPSLQGLEDASVKKKILDFGEGGGPTSCLIESALKKEPEEINFERSPTLTFAMNLENPSLAPRSVPFKYVLSQDVREKDIIDPGELKVGFDFEQDLYYLFHDNVVLNPGEKRVFLVGLNNKWALNKKKVYASKVYIESMLRVAEKQGLKDVSALGQKSLASIVQLLKRPRVTDMTEENMRIFREDQKAFEEINASIEQMKDIMVAKGVSPDLSLVEQERGCLEAQGAGQKELDDALNMVITLRAQKQGTSGSVFTGKSLASVSTWKIISYIILFLGVISGVFYFVTIREQKSAMFDVLTGAFTRAYALERLREEIKVAKGSRGKCSLLVMDVDKFKKINDTHGHSVGDTILKEFVIAIRKGIRATDLVGRFGGDEFMIILPTSEKQVALRIANGVCRAVEGTAIKVSPELTLSIATSIGVATFPDDSPTADDLFNKADKALYVVKKRGGNDAQAYEAGA